MTAEPALAGGSRPSRRLFAAALIGRIANEMTAVAVVLLVLERGEGAALAGVIAGALALPGILTGPLLGGLLDRARRPLRVIAAEQVIGAVGLAALALAVGNAPAIVSVGLAILDRRPAAALDRRDDGVLTGLSGETFVARATSLEAASFGAATVAGPLLAATVAGLAGAAAAVLVQAALKLLAMAGTLAEAEARSAQSAPPPPSPGLRATLAEALRHFSAGPLAAITVCGSLAMAGRGLLVVAFPFFAVEQLGHGRGFAGALWAAFAAGSALGAIALSAAGEALAERAGRARRGGARRARDAADREPGVERGDARPARRLRAPLRARARGDVRGPSPLDAAGVHRPGVHQRRQPEERELRPRRGGLRRPGGRVRARGDDRSRRAHPSGGKRDRCRPAGISPAMRFLFATLQHIESEFYGRVGRLLKRQGHEVTHLTYSRRAALVLRGHGDEAHCLPELMAEVSPVGSWREEEARIVSQYPIPSLHEVYRTDLPCRDERREGPCVERTVRHFLAIEELFRRLEPQIVVPEVGNESIRTVSHLVGEASGATTLFLMFTIFDSPLRLYADTMDAPIVSADELRPLTGAEEAELDDFITRYTERNRPIREYRRVTVNLHRAYALMRHAFVRATWDRDNDYLRPGSWVARDLREMARRRRARGLYSAEPSEPGFVYFPLHVTDDYKILRLRPHCVDQEALITQVANALPPGVELVIKEHPMSIGRNPLGMLRNLVKLANVQAGRAPHQLARADPPLGRGGDDLLDCRSRGAALLEAGAHPRAAPSTPATGPPSTSTTSARSASGCPSCSSSAPSASEPGGSCMPRCATAIPALRCSSTARMRTPSGSRGRSTGRRAGSSARSVRDPPIGAESSGEWRAAPLGGPRGRPAPTRPERASAFHWWKATIAHAGGILLILPRSIVAAERREMIMRRDTRRRFGPLTAMAALLVAVVALLGCGSSDDERQRTKATAARSRPTWSPTTTSPPRRRARRGGDCSSGGRPTSSRTLPRWSLTSPEILDDVGEKDLESGQARGHGLQGIEVLGVSESGDTASVRAGLLTFTPEEPGEPPPDEPTASRPATFAMEKDGDSGCSTAPRTWSR